MRDAASEGRSSVTDLAYRRRPDSDVASLLEVVDRGFGSPSSLSTTADVRDPGKQSCFRVRSVFLSSDGARLSLMRDAASEGRSSVTDLAYRRRPDSDVASLLEVVDRGFGSPSSLSTTADARDPGKQSCFRVRSVFLSSDGARLSLMRDAASEGRSSVTDLAYRRRPDSDVASLLEVVDRGFGSPSSLSTTADARDPGKQSCFRVRSVFLSSDGARLSLMRDAASEGRSSVTDLAYRRE
ncbi:hypothetical protein NDU88_007894 [Pleurodeles waltl]|uniref:Uncharacterized protein n=1 Tax=Pleurodeles waltl TaxID=8319 RepID=A0AAV7QQD3_PLEWA|nr:hypothetical protein NDU88_007894 [Pleurodeles waltl]